MAEIVSNPNIPDITVSCKNSQGGVITANVLRLRRYHASFEVYNPYSILQLSEVLSDFRIRMNDRVVYSGKATVSGIVNTGFVLVCEVTLAGAWLDVDLLADREGIRSLSQQFDTFVDEWRRAHEVENGFKLTVADIQNSLMGLQRWLEQVDLGVRSASSGNRDEAEKEIVHSLQDRLIAEVHPMMQRFEEAAENVPEEMVATHKFYVRRQIHPLVLCSPFIYRTFNKPLGYAGDYEMVNMMLRQSLEGASLFAKTLNYVYLETGPVIAHRNRITYLTDMLKTEVSRAAADGRRCRVLNLGCGPAQEVLGFMRDHDVSDMCDFSLLDFNPETLDYTRARLAEVRSRSDRTTVLNYLQRSVHQLLKQASTGDVEMEWGSYDVVYCAGLFDYLSQRVCARLMELFYKLLKPGGKLVATNVTLRNPIRHWMEYVLEWNLIYRDDEQMMGVVPKADGVEAEIKRDATGVNIFLEVKKRDSNRSS